MIQLSFTFTSIIIVWSLLLLLLLLLLSSSIIVISIVDAFAITKTQKQKRIERSNNNSNNNIKNKQQQFKKKKKYHQIIKPLHEINNKESIFAIEEKYLHDYNYIIGSDESGTGCIAGPIVIVSCCLLGLLKDNNDNNNIDQYIIPPMNNNNNNNLLTTIVQDSKRLNINECQYIYDYIQKYSNLFQYNVIIKSNNDIDNNKSVQACIQDSFIESITSLVEKISNNNDNNNNIKFYSIIDGHKSYSNKLNISSRSYKNGDQYIYTIALASCIARTIRHNIMKEISIQYPQYDFNIHNGYPTKYHIQKLHQYGISPIHRISCKPVRNRLYNHINNNNNINDDDSNNNKDNNNNDNNKIDNIVVSTKRRQILTTFISGCYILQKTLPPSNAMTIDSKTGIALPDIGEIENAIPKNWDDIGIEEFFDSTSFTRLDNTDDSKFYTEPRFVEHIDEQAVQTLTKYNTNIINEYINNNNHNNNIAILDLCSSWTSHIDQTQIKQRQQIKRIVGLGMNEKELLNNHILTEYIVQDLNNNPKLTQYNDNAFDIILCQLSIDYLIKPIEICNEIYRILKPNGGSIHIIYSNRLFISKAIALWTGKDDIDHTYIISTYLHYSQFNNNNNNIYAKDLSIRNKKGKIIGDPLYVVIGYKRNK